MRTTFLVVTCAVTLFLGPRPGYAEDGSWVHLDRWWCGNREPTAREDSPAGWSRWATISDWDAHAYCTFSGTYVGNAEIAAWGESMIHREWEWQGKGEPQKTKVATFERTHNCMAHAVVQERHLSGNTLSVTAHEATAEVPYQVQGTWHLSQTVWDTPNHIPVAVPGDPIEVYAEGPYTIWTADAAVGASASGHRV